MNTDIIMGDTAIRYPFVTIMFALWYFFLTIIFYMKLAYLGFFSKYYLFLEDFFPFYIKLTLKSLMILEEKSS